MENLVMPSLYTETLQELLINKGYGTDHENQSLTDVLEVMRKFPDFVFGENIELSMLDLFLDKYDIREIGAETEELFLHFWKERANELLMEYTPKIQMWLDHFNDLFKFTVTLELEETIEKENTEDINRTRTDNLSRNNDNTYYLNPVTATITNLKVQDVDKNTETNTGTQDFNEDNTLNEEKTRTMSRDVLQSVWGKTRAQLLSQILDLQQVYNMCLKDFATIFMGCL